MSAFVTARTYLESKIVRYALVIGSEVLSNVVDWQDRGSCILFGDGAGAVILEASKNDSWVPVLHAYKVVALKQVWMLLFKQPICIMTTL